MGLIYVELPTSLTKISKNTFAGCSYLQEVKINYGVRTIEENAFDSCVTLTTLTLPKSIEKIEKNAFLDCNGLRNVLYSGGIAAYSSISIDPTGNETLDDAFLAGLEEGI
jgi:hypothetical protein